MIPIAIAFLSRYWGLVLILLAWQAWVGLSGVNVIVMPRPVDVLFELAANAGFYLANAALTFALSAAGLVLGIALGTALALLTGTSRILRGILIPFGLIMASIPVVTLIPILARLLGFDLRTILAIVMIISFFPAFVFTAAGMRALPPGSADLMTVLGASPFTRFVHIVIPSAIPNWAIGVRVAAPTAILSAMLGEFLINANGVGLGGIFRAAMSDFDTPRAIAASVVATLVSVATFTLASWAERKIVDRWS